jgi:hypothetical protein
MKTITYEQIKGPDPCFDPIWYGIPENYQASLKDFVIEYRDKAKSIVIVAVLNKEFFNNRDLTLFGVWAASQVEKSMRDARSTNLLDIVEQYAFGEVDKAVLKQAVDEAKDTDLSSFARSAALAAVLDAPTAAAFARWAIREAAKDAEAGAARAAEAQALNAQINKLLEMIDKPNGAWYQRRVKSTKKGGGKK